MTRYQAYEAHLAGRTIREIFGRPAAFPELKFGSDHSSLGSRASRPGETIRPHSS
jgi:hypothetical protein